MGPAGTVAVGLFAARDVVVPEVVVFFGFPGGAEGEVVGLGADAYPRGKDDVLA